MHEHFTLDSQFHHTLVFITNKTSIYFQVQLLFIADSIRTFEKVTEIIAVH